MVSGSHVSESEYVCLMWYVCVVGSINCTLSQNLL